MNILPPALRALGLCAVLAASSCVMQTHMGRVMRENMTVRTGVDTFHPVDGKIYYATVDGQERLYILAPEVTYRARHDLVEFPDPSEQLAGKLMPEGTKAAKVQPTGRKFWVEVVMKEPFERYYPDFREERGTGRVSDPDRLACCFVRTVDSLPKGAKVWQKKHAVDAEAPASFFGVISTKQRKGAWAVKAASWPVTCILDPAVSIAGSCMILPTGFLGGLTTVPVMCLADVLRPWAKEEGGEAKKSARGMNSCLPDGWMVW